MKKAGKTARPFRYDLSQIPYDYTVEVRNRYKGLDLIDRVPDELWNEVHDIVQETGIVQMGEGYIKVENCQAFLYNMHISVYGFGNRFNHEVKRPRRLLLHKREIMKLAQMVNTKGGTIVPLKMYLKNGLIKVEIAYCQGKTHADIRETLRKREADMDMRRNLGKRG